MKCPGCNARLKSDDLFCYRCGTKIEPPTPKPQKEKSGKKPLIVVLSVIAAVGVGTSSFFATRYFLENSADKKAQEWAAISDSQYAVFEKGFTDVKVDDKDTAIEAVSSVAEAIGITDVQEELYVEDEVELSDGCVYQIQQYYNDMPVLGRTISLAVNDNNTPVVLTANTINIEERVYTAAQNETADAAASTDSAEQIIENLAPDNIEIDSERMEKSVTDFLEKQENLKIEDAAFPEEPENCLAIFSPLEETPQIAVDMIVDFMSDNGYQAYEVLYNPVEDSVLSAESVLYDAGKSAEVRSEEGALATGSLEDDRYSLYNDEHHIAVYDIGEKYKGDNNGSVEFNFERFGYSVISSENELFGNDDVQTLSYMTFCDSYFKRLGFSGFRRTRVGVRDDYENGNNARGGSADGNAIVLIGSNVRSDDYDLLGHEFTHAVTRSIAKWSSGSGQTKAVNEGISDIFGTLLEADCSDEPMNWYKDLEYLGGGSRSISDPEKTGNKTEYDNKAVEDAYQYSTVISHAAYMMAEGNEEPAQRMDADLLAKVWYKALFLMHTDTTFSQCANAVYNAARATDGVTDEQLVGIRTAFGETGFGLKTEIAYSVLKGTTLKVISADNQAYDNYHIRIVDTADSQTVVDVDVTDDNGYILNLESGRYVIELTDNAVDGSETRCMKTLHIKDTIRKEVKASVTVLTDFGKKEKSSESTTQKPAEKPTEKSSEPPTEKKDKPVTFDVSEADVEVGHAIDIKCTSGHNLENGTLMSSAGEFSKCFKIYILGDRFNIIANQEGSETFTFTSANGEVGSFTLNAIKPKETDADYSSYLGNWQYVFDNNGLLDNDHAMVTSVTFNEINSNNVYLTISKGNISKVCEIDVYGQIIDGKIDFSYDKDGWENSGHGTIVLNENSIYLYADVDRYGPHARMGLVCDETLTR